MNPKIIYAPEWIDKILSGEKTMTIRRTQYSCGVYDVVSEAEPDTVMCRIEIVRVDKWDTEKWLGEIQEAGDRYNMTDIFIGQAPFAPNDDEYMYIQDFECFAKSSGFASISDFIQYHRENYAPVKFAHTFELVKGDNHDA